MTWSKQARAAALAARKAKGGTSKQRFNQRRASKGIAPKYGAGKSRSQRFAEGVHSMTYLSNADRKSLSTKKAAKAVVAHSASKGNTFTNKPQHQNPITGAGTAAHGVSSSHSQAPKVMPPSGYDNGPNPNQTGKMQRNFQASVHKLRAQGHDIPLPGAKTKYKNKKKGK